MLGIKLDLRPLVDTLRPLEGMILAAVIQGPWTTGVPSVSLAIAWPRNMPEQDHAAVIDGCLSLCRKTTLTTADYEEQDPRYVCDPLIWFHDFPYHERDIRFPDNLRGP